MRPLRLLLVATLGLLSSGAAPLFAAGGAPDNVAADNATAAAPAPIDNAATDNAASGKPAVPWDNAIRAEAQAVVEAADQKHTALEQTILDRVVWFDNFFGNVRTEDSRPTEYLLRWVNALRWEEKGNKFKYRTSVRASMRLPRLGNKLHLVVSGESDSEPGAGNPEDPGNPGFDRTLQNARIVNTELRYRFLQTATQNLFLGAGVRVRFPMELFVRSRYQHTVPLGSIALLRLGETVFWKNTTKFGETTEIDLERRLDALTVVRLANSATLSQKSMGLEWGSDLSLQRELSPRSAITFAGGAFGATRPATVITNYRVLSRYRRNALTEWLFFELEPEVSWPRTPSGARSTAYAVTGRIELVFHGSTADVP